MITARYYPRSFTFLFNAGTSRGVLTTKNSFFIKIWDTDNPDIYGLGEVSLIPGLSPDNTNLLPEKLDAFTANPVLFLIQEDLSTFPALKFGIETAFTDLQQGGNRILFPSDFTRSQNGIVINGLVWMGDKQTMLTRINEKIEAGFTCIKIKIGAINFSDEIDLLRYIRKNFTSTQLEIRLDANGAFAVSEALEKLKILSDFGIQSVEQPIKQGQIQAMANLCAQSPIPIALDEELIGVTDFTHQEQLLQLVKPQYIVLKPSLLGGIHDTRAWILLAQTTHTGWWITSALESNVGLNAIAQFTATQNTLIPQGLGTGQIYENNIASPLYINKNQLWYNQNSQWNLTEFS